MLSTQPATKPAASNTEMVSRFTAAWAARQRTQHAPRGAFVLDDAPLSDDDIANPVALLPMVVWHAENLYRYGINAHGFGVTYRPDSEALLSRSVDLDRSHRSSSELLCFMLEALEDASNHLPSSAAVPGAVELRSLVNQFAAAMGATPGQAPSAGHSANARPQG